MVALFSQCEAAKTLLDDSEDIKIKWSWAVQWLNEELERGRGHYPGSGQFSYNNWSPPAQSNETANGYFLERSHSARLTLEKACELLPDEVRLRSRLLPKIISLSPFYERNVILWQILHFF